MRRRSSKKLVLNSIICSCFFSEQSYMVKINTQPTCLPMLGEAKPSKLQTGSDMSGNICTGEKFLRGGHT